MASDTTTLAPTDAEIDAAYRKVWSTIPHAQRLSAFAHEIASTLAARWANSQPAPAVGNSGFDYKTAADLLNGKTVNDEAIRKFVASSRRAHDDIAWLQATLLSVRGELASREAEIALLKKTLMDAEPAPPAQEARVPLSSQECRDMLEEVDHYNFAIDLIRAVEKHHGIAAAQKETPC